MRRDFSEETKERGQNLSTTKTKLVTENVNPVFQQLSQNNPEISQGQILLNKLQLGTCSGFYW